MGENVHIVMGKNSFNLFEVSLLHLKVTWNNTLYAWIGYARFDNHNALAYILGPLTSFTLFAVMRFYLVSKVKREFMVRLIYSSSYWCLYQGIFTIIPIKYSTWLYGYGNFTSDGMKFFNSIFSY